MKRLRTFLSAGLLALTGATLATLPAERDAYASVVISALFDEVVNDSSGAAIVTPTEQRTTWVDGRIYTYTHVHVDRSVAGTLVSDPWVRTMGGVVGKVGQSVEGEAVLTVGKPGLLFLQPLAEEGSGVYAVTARAQGQFPTVADAQGITRFIHASGVGARVPTPSARVARVAQARAQSGLAPEAPLVTDVLHGRAVEDGVREISAAWSRIHGHP